VITEDRKNKARRLDLRRGRPKPWYPAHPFVRRKAEAKEAAKIAAWIASEQRPEQKPDEHELFVALHACAYRIAQEGTPEAERTEWVGRRQRIRSHIVEQNLGLVYSTATRFRSPHVDYDDLRGEGLMALVRAVDWYDPWRGARFSTYACHAIIRAMIRHAKQARKHLAYHALQDDAVTETTAPAESWTDSYVARLRRALADNLGELTPRESDILGQRFPGDERAKRTLEEVGDRCGLSKERVRQIQKRALRKLRDVLEVDPMLQ